MIDSEFIRVFASGVEPGRIGFVNLADASTWLNTLAGIFSGLLVAAHHGVPWWIIVLFAAGGLVIGFLAGLVSRVLGYWILFRGRRGRMEGVLLIAYMLNPIVFLFLVIAVTIGVGVPIAKALS